MIDIQSWDQFFTAAITTMTPFVFGAILYALKLGWNFIETKTHQIKNQALSEALYNAELELQHVTTTVVSALNQTVVNNLKAQNGNALSPADAQKIKSDAINTVKSLLSKEAQDLLTAHKGDIELYLQNLIEAEVLRQKK
jgi:hypothetical protein